MRLTISVIVALILIFPRVTRADGPPMTPTGEVTIDHVEFVLSAEQIEILGRTRYIEFSAEQLEFCRKLNAQFPKRLLAIGPAYSDCTCGMGAYGMWIRPQRIAIATHTITGYDPKIEKEMEGGEIFVDERPLILQAQTDPIGAAASRRELLMDVNGDFFIYGKALSAADAVRVFETISKNTEERRYIFINIPPPGEAAIEAKVQDALKVIRAEAAKHNTNVYITG